MDHIWKEDGLDLRLTPYSIAMTGPDSGMIQVWFEKYLIFLFFIVSVDCHTFDYVGRNSP
jgi:hypothetical protein